MCEQHARDPYQFPAPPGLRAGVLAREADNSAGDFPAFAGLAC
jgi:hypothetical protein